MLGSSAMLMGFYGDKEETLERAHPQPDFKGLSLTASVLLKTHVSPGCEAAGLLLCLVYNHKYLTAGWTSRLL